MRVAQRCTAHVSQLDGTTRAAVDEKVAALRMKARRCDHLCQLLHVLWLDVHDIETDLAVVHVPEVDAQVVCRQKCFAVAAGRNRVDMVRVGICVHTPWGGTNGRVSARQCGNLQA